MSLTKQYFKYVSQNIFGLLGTSCYILADTYFISQAAGTSGVALLNLCLPIYNFIFAIGSMLGLGAATRYAILRAQGDERSERYFSNALLWALVFALPFMLTGIFCPEVLLRFMGGDAEIVALGVGYARIFLLFTPFFMCNYIVSAFVRNDGDPHWPWWRPSAEASSTWCSITSSCSPWASACPARRWRRRSRRC